MFYKAKNKNSLLLLLPDLFLNDIKIKFAKTLSHELWKHNLENPSGILESVGIHFKAIRVLNSKSLQSIYFALVDQYMNYANIDCILSCHVRVWE